MTNSLIPSNGSLKKIGGGVGVAGLVAVLYMMGVVEIAPGNHAKIQRIEVDIAVIMNSQKSMQNDIKEIKEAMKNR